MIFCETTNQFNGWMKAEKSGKHLEISIRCSILTINKAIKT